MNIIFSESIYDSINKQMIKHNCDDCFIITKYNKEKTMNQMRLFIFFEDYYDNQHKKQISKWYSEEKIRLKDINRKLHKLFYKEKEQYFYNILEQFNVVEFIQVPKCCKNIKINNGRFVIFDGNTKYFIGETKNEYYVAKWNGS